MKKFYKNCDLKVPGSFVFCKEISTSIKDNEIFQAGYFYELCFSKTIEICPNQHADLLTFLFTEDSLKIKKGLELVSRSHFS